jgi:amino acid adenylation domain-containing protein
VPEPIESAVRECAPRAVAQWPAPPDAPAQDWSRQPDKAAEARVGADDLAYVAFTSGSTGEPKAIAGTHAPLAHFFEWHRATSQLGPADRFSVLSGLAHDPLLRDVLGAFWAGATACMPDGARFAQAGYLGEWLARERVSVCHLTPAMADLIGIRGEGEPAAELPALRRVCFGGDLLRADTVEALRRIAPGARYVNFYGATETPQAMGWYEVPRELSSLPGRIPIGRGIDDVQLLVLNSAGLPAAVGEVGEIHVRTPYLARGYLGDAELSAQRFVPGPCRAGAGDRMYRTGDLGRYRPDGTVEFAGRVDSQVKLRGFRIELGEVEAALREHPAVGEAAVELVARNTREARLVGYVVPRPGGSSAGGDLLREFLRARLPEHMVPSQFVEMDRLPLTPNGKVDRRRLPAPAAPKRSRVPPHTPTQLAIAAIWRELLEAQEVGAEDNFFELGGHSLVATRVLARLRARLGVELPLRALFQAPTVAGLARLVDAARGAQPENAPAHEEITI